MDSEARFAAERSGRRTIWIYEEEKKKEKRKKKKKKERRKRGERD